MNRTGRQRLDAIPAAMERREQFYARVKEAEGDAVRCADLMAEAIAMKFEANGLETVGRDGRQTASIEELVSVHCMLEARDAYLRARGSNTPPL
ncbi:hypothetical protein ACVIGB_000558 [Bradyrhizobium sp. USDA 4341]